jgi:hypothetical protein
MRWEKLPYVDQNDNHPYVASGMAGKSGKMHEGRSGYKSNLCGREAGNERKLQDFIKCCNCTNNTLSAGAENGVERKMQKESGQVSLTLTDFSVHLTFYQSRTSLIIK